jgi:hypothetical protein
MFILFRSFFPPTLNPKSTLHALYVITAVSCTPFRNACDCLPRGSEDTELCACRQVIFTAGILTGVSLAIAGRVLRSQSRSGDLLVLVYIGCMITMVCTVLLSVQCCVRRNVKRRKRALRATREQRNAVASASNRRSNAAHGDVIPMQDLSGNTAYQQQRVSAQQQQYQPLLVRLVQQQTATIDNQRHSGNTAHAPYHLQPSYR